jgi:hypothetical protein
MEREELLLSAPLVGMKFRPPAFDVTMLLPTGAKLLLQREPLNPYDPDAIKVFLPGFSAEGEQEKIFNIMLQQLELDEFGNLSWDRNSLTDPLPLGYIANSPKTGGKYASELAPLLDAETFYPAELGFYASGNPQVLFKEPVREEPGHFVSDPEDVGSQ